MFNSTSKLLVVQESFARMFSRSRMAAVCLCILALVSSSSFAQSGGEPTNVEPVTVIGDGLIAGTEVLLQQGDVLPPGELLLPGDVVIGGSVVNVNSSSRIVLISGDVLVLAPGSLLYTIDPLTPAWRCSCKCGSTWRVFNVSSANCGGWGELYMHGRICIDPGTGLPATWQECMQVFDLPTAP